MKFTGLWSLGTGNGMRTFTGTSVDVVATANVIQVNAVPDMFFSGQIQNLSQDVDVILAVSASLRGVASTVNYTLHAREFLECQNVPITNIGVKINGTAILQGIGEFNELMKAELAGLMPQSDNIFNWLQNSYIRIGKTSEQSFSATPAWQQSAKSTNPAAGTTLSTKTVAAANLGYIVGIYINSPETNTFSLNWTSGGVAQQKLYTIGAANGGMIYITDNIPINSGKPADAGTAVTIKNINAGAGDYQADILFMSEG